MSLAKDQLRQQYKQIRTALSTNQRAAQQQKLYQQFIASPIYNQSSTIGFYHPILSELDPQLMINKALLEGKTTTFPKIINKQLRQMIYQTEQNNDIKAENIDIILVPCVAFNKQGYRLGMGSGFFDTFIKNLNPHKKPYLLGIGFDEQYCNDLPTDHWDEPLDNILTAKGFIKPIAD